MAVGDMLRRAVVREFVTGVVTMPPADYITHGTHLHSGWN